MPAIPRLVLHPGFPKCATSSIQQGFVAKNHALARQIGVKFLGRSFLPNNGYPEVIRLMDAPGACAEEVKAASYNPKERYFMSNEALGGNRQFLDVLQSRFDIEKAIFTIRLPALQAISNYRYSGWISSSFATAATRRKSGLSQAQKRMEAKFRSYKEMGIPILLCPLENPGGILTQFCQTAFGALIDLNNVQTERRVNQSIGLAFAHALYQELEKQAGAFVPTELKRRLVKAAQTHKLEQGLNSLICSEDRQIFSEIQEDACLEYASLLATHGLPMAEVNMATAVAAENLTRLIRSPVATPEEMSVLKSHARTIIGHARDQS